MAFTPKLGKVIPIDAGEPPSQQSDQQSTGFTPKLGKVISSDNQQSFTQQPTVQQPKKGLFGRIADYSKSALSGAQSLINPLMQELERPVVSVVRGFQGSNEAVNTPFGRVEPYTSLTPGKAAGKALNLGITAATLGTAPEAGTAAETLGKTVLQGAKSGAKFGAVSGAANALENDGDIGDVAKGALSGAAVGGLAGGAVTGVVAGGAKALQEVKHAISPDKFDEALSAIKPSVKNRNFKRDLTTTFETLSPEELSNWKDLNTAKSAIDNKKTEIWDAIGQALQKGDEQGLKIDGTKVSEKIRSLTNNPVIKRENPALVEKIESLAKSYEDGIPIMEAEQIIEHKNAALQSYYKKNATDKVAAMKADPLAAADIHIADTLRSEIDRILEEAQNAGFGELKKKYGALANVSKAIDQRIPVVERQNINSLQEQLNTGRAIGKVAKSLANRDFGDAVEGAGQIAASKYMKYQDSADTKITKAAQKAIQEKLKK